MASRHRNIGRAVARESFALAVAAPEVVAHRMLRMWLAGGNWSQRDRAELHRMSAEKVAAFYESWNAMFLEMFRANIEFTLSCMGWWPWSAASSKRFPAQLSAHGQRTIAAMLGAGIAPVRRRAVANVKRLRRRTRS
jgi:hypothetical protein